MCVCGRTDFPGVGSCPGSWKANRWCSWSRPPVYFPPIATAQPVTHKPADSLEHWELSLKINNKREKKHTRNSPADFLSLLLCQSVFQKLFPHLFIEVDEPVTRLTFGPSFANSCREMGRLLTDSLSVCNCVLSIHYWISLFFNTVPPPLSVILLWILVCNAVF